MHNRMISELVLVIGAVYFASICGCSGSRPGSSGTPTDDPTDPGGNPTTAVYYSLLEFSNQLQVTEYPSAIGVNVELPGDAGDSAFIPQMHFVRPGLGAALLVDSDAPAGGASILTFDDTNKRWVKADGDAGNFALDDIDPYSTSFTSFENGDVVAARLECVYTGSAITSLGGAITGLIGGQFVQHSIADVDYFADDANHQALMRDIGGASGRCRQYNIDVGSLELAIVIEQGDLYYVRIAYNASGLEVAEWRKAPSAAVGQMFPVGADDHETFGLLTTSPAQYVLVDYGSNGYVTALAVCEKEACSAVSDDVLAALREATARCDGGICYGNGHIVHPSDPAAPKHLLGLSIDPNSNGFRLHVHHIGTSNAQVTSIPSPSTELEYRYAFIDPGRHDVLQVRLYDADISQGLVAFEYDTTAGTIRESSFLDRENDSNNGVFYGQSLPYLVSVAPEPAPFRFLID